MGRRRPRGTKPGAAPRRLPGTRGGPVLTIFREPEPEAGGVWTYAVYRGVCRTCGEAVDVSDYVLWRKASCSVECVACAGGKDTR